MLKVFGNICCKLLVDRRSLKTVQSNRKYVAAITSLFIGASAGIAPSQGNSRLSQPAPPPLARVNAVVTDYFGIKVSDPYRWMEEASNGPEFVAYLKSQNTHTRAELDSLPGRAALLARIQKLDNAIPTVRAWARGGSSIFYLETAPGAPTASLYVRDASGKPRKLLDPVSLQAGSQHAAIDYFQPSWDGRYVIAGVSLGGSENSTIHVLESQNGHLLQDVITRTQYGYPSWRADSQAFYYARLQELAPGAAATAIYENEKVFLHVLGDKVKEDPLVFGVGASASANIPKAGFVNVIATPGSNYLLGIYAQGTSNSPAIYCTRGGTLSAVATWRKVISSDAAVATTPDSSMVVHGSTLYLLVEKNAPNRKLIAVDLDHPNAGAMDIVPTSDAVLAGVYAAKDGLYLLSRHGVTFELQYSPYDLPLKWKRVPVPYEGTISSMDANVLLRGSVFRLESWTQSDQAYAYDPSTGRVTNTALIEKNPANYSAVEAREVEAISADGTKIPVSLICQKGLVLDGSHPTFLGGYGAYGISVDPAFAPPLLALVERGGLFALVHARGGGELGEAWHRAGQKETKQHTIDDMVAAARYLIAAKFTSTAHLAVEGTSAGGIAVGGSLVQHPELFAAAIDEVGMTDMLRFQTSQGGAANIPEFGDVTNAAQFKYLYPISAYQHVVDGTKYPAVLGITGANDPRVPTWMVAKMVARLQAATASRRPVLLRVDFDAGHGFGSSRPQSERQLADIMSFILWQSGDPAFQPPVSATKR